MVYATVSLSISATNEDARTVKNNVQKVIEKRLFEEIREKMK